MIRVAVTSVYVDDQNKAEDFYTRVLGFEKRQDIPLGDARWLTVAPPGSTDGVELLLEPNDNPIAQNYQRALVEAGLPTHIVLATDDINTEFERLTHLGVVFTINPTQTGPVTQAVFDDTCGNLVTLAQLG